MRRPLRTLLVTVISLASSAGLAHAADAEPPHVEPINRRFAFKANYGFGLFYPADVNAYLKHQVANESDLVQTLSKMYLLFSGDVSVAYFPVQSFGIRPSLLYSFAYNTSTHGGRAELYWLHSLAPGLSFDFVLETHKLARFFASPGVGYQFGWFRDYAARGLGVELALGTELSFGARRNKGVSVALALRYANLHVDSRPTQTGSSEPSIDDLDFSSVMLRVGFQYGS